MGWRVMWFAPPRRRFVSLSGSDGGRDLARAMDVKGFSSGGMERRNPSDPGVPDVPLIDQSAQGDKGAEKRPIISC